MGLGRIVTFPLLLEPAIYFLPRFLARAFLAAILPLAVYGYFFPFTLGILIPRLNARIADNGGAGERGKPDPPKSAKS